MHMRNKIAILIALSLAVHGSLAPCAAAPISVPAFSSAGTINYNVGTMNTKNKFVALALGVFGMAALVMNFVIGAGADDVSVSYAYPVPYKPSSGHRNITFTLLPTQGTIKVYTVVGEMVKEIGFSSPVNGEVTWDARNTQGEDIASDVYLYVITSGDNKKFGKLMVVR